MPSISAPARLSLVAVLLAWGFDVSALGLGDLRTGSLLGEHLLAEVNVLAEREEFLHSGCFRLRRPVGASDLPWLRRGKIHLRRGSPPILEIRSDRPLHDPIVQIGIGVTCGYELSRDYTLFLSPREMAVELRTAGEEKAVSLRRPASFSPEAARFSLPPSEPMPRPARKYRRPAAAAADRLVLDGGESADKLLLRLSADLRAGHGNMMASGKEQREILRLEYRLLAELNRQADSQLALAEKLRNIEATLGALEGRVSGLAQRLERTGGEGVGPSPVAAGEKSVAAPVRHQGLSEWGFYALLIGAALGIGGWLGWQQRRNGIVASSGA